MQHVPSQNEHVRYFCQSKCSVSYKHTLEAFLSVHSTVICSLHKSSARFSANTATQNLQRLYARAGIAGATSHSGRRTWLTTLSQKGVSVFVLADMAGHRSIQTTQRYVTVNDEMKRNAAELI
jgi:integrase